MLLLMIVISTFPSCYALVDCAIACRRCRENREHAILLEVHCAMCRECKLRRREKQQQQSSYRSSFSVVPISIREKPRLVQKNANQTQLLSARIPDSQKPSEEYMEYPEGCPTPPPCEYEDNSLPRISTTTTTTITTTQKPCPPIRVCKKLIMVDPKTTTTCRQTFPPCVPCMPSCWMPCPQYLRPWDQNQQSPQLPQHQPAATNHPIAYPPPSLTYTTIPDYYYIYLGVPKKLMSKPRR